MRRNQLMWATLIFSGTAALFLAMTLAALRHLRWARRLPSLETLVAPHRFALTAERLPRCSVVIAARDEEARIEQTLRHLLAQRGVETEFIIVDDRSADRTAEILHRLANEDARVRVKRVEVLPDGWLGKCHACHLGATAATGDWILFTDADCWLKPDVIARAVWLAERDGADHVTLAPGTVVKSLGTRAWHLLFLTSLLNWFAGVNRDRPKSYLGLGAFNLVRAAAYRQSGGYQALRLTVVDDVKLGLLLRRAGKRTRGFLGVDDVVCHWGTTVGSMVKIMEKNYFAITDFRVWVVIAGSAFLILVFSIIVLGLMTRTAAGFAAAFSPLSLILPAAILARRLGWAWPCAIFTPLMFPVFWYALLNSTFVTLRQGGIRWRETFYPLDILRAGNVR
ncbi:MAG TPA: glycosyltransferase family 2 protein [Candidatus Acidoferrum sp.]|jgi:glycosyltransferase involved in cell wall biosynthesis|nr:glycosyltransferase family 2 protein [Candidatus Acidoferrum sp.]